MLEESVYTRMVISGNSHRALVELVRKNRPPKGIVALQPVTEQQFAKMDIITGDYETDVISSMDKVVEI